MAGKAEVGCCTSGETQLCTSGQVLLSTEKNQNCGGQDT